MDGLLGAAVALAGLGAALGAALVAWRWWLADRAEERKLRAEAVRVDVEALRLLPGRVAELEQQLKTLAWRKG